MNSGEAREDAISDEQADSQTWMQAHNDKDHDKAIELLQEKIESADDEDEKLSLELWLGKVKANVRFNEVVKYLQDKVEEHPDNSLGYLLLSLTCEDNDLYDDSLAVLGRGLESAASKDALSWFKAHLLDELGDTDEAKAILRNLIDDNPEYPPAHSTLAQILITAPVTAVDPADGSRNARRIP